MTSPVSIVLDCMVFVQAVASRGPSFQCYQHAISEESNLLLSLATYQELGQVLTRPELRRKLPGVTAGRVEALMHHLKSLATFIDPVPRHLAFPPDPKDEPYINVAVEGRASSLITRDRALLRLSDPCDPISTSIRNVHPSLRVEVPEQFLEGLAGPLLFF